MEVFEIRDLGEQIVAIGHIRARGHASGAEVESPGGWVVELKNGKAVRVREYLDPKEALEAAGLRE
jgi:ketosteroid isomerase-like protein